LALSCSHSRLSSIFGLFASIFCSGFRRLSVMSSDRYQKGMDKLKELTIPDEHSPTGHMEIGESFAKVAPDLQRMVVEFAFGDVYARSGLDNKQKVLCTISALV